jgi:hypothetical protein
MKKNAIVNLQGGLGNQIFQTAFALELKSKNIRTICDIHFYDSKMQFPRKLEIAPSMFGLKTIKYKNSKIFSRLGILFKEMDTFRIEDLKYLNRFVGYYQDFLIIEKHKDTLRKILNIHNAPHDPEKVAIHIRQDDYKKINQHLGDSYYKKSIEEFLAYNENFVFDIFTDDTNFVPDLKIFKKLNSIYYPEENINPLEVFINMSKYQNYIIANSSFSALAAYLSNSKSKKVIYPEPWWRSSEIQIKNIPLTWIPISND